MTETLTHNEHEKASEYIIRAATINDVEAIRRMQAQSWLDTYQNAELGVTAEWLSDETQSWLTDEALEASRQYLGAYFSDPAHFYRVALHNNDVVGLLHLNTLESGKKHLWGLYTAQKTHGTGLAQQLMVLADTWSGNAEVELEVAAYNERAKAFYRKNGFKEVEGSGGLFKDKIPDIKMVRPAKNVTHEGEKYEV